MNVLVIPNPIKGAAYQVIYETVWPANLTSAERLAEIEAECTRIVEWARTQPFDVTDAYQWAASEILKGCRQQLAQSDLAKSVHAVLATLPKPPKMEKAA